MTSRQTLTSVTDSFFTRYIFTIYILLMIYNVWYIIDSFYGTESDKGITSV